jgi:hypothetical protein
LHHVSFGSLPPLSTLKFIIPPLFNIKEDFELKYVDQDGDLISITNDVELLESFNYYSQNTPKVNGNVEMLLLVLNVTMVDIPPPSEFLINTNYENMLLPSKNDNEEMECRSSIDLEKSEINIDSTSELGNVNRECKQEEIPSNNTENVFNQIGNTLSYVWQGVVSSFQTISDKAVGQLKEIKESGWIRPDETFSDYLQRYKQDMLSLFQKEEEKPREEIIQSMNITQDNVFLRD